MTPLNKYHTHEDIVLRKKRVPKKKQDEDKEYADVDYLMQQEKKETSEDDEALYCVYDNWNKPLR